MKGRSTAATWSLAGMLLRGVRHQLAEFAERDGDAEMIGIVSMVDRAITVAERRAGEVPS